MSKIKLSFMCGFLFLGSVAFAAEDQRDLVTRITNIKCAGEGTQFEFGWDSAIHPLGPAKVIINGKQVEIGGMKLAITPEGSLYEVGGLKMIFKNEDGEKKSFQTTVQYQGKDVVVKCSNESSLKFLRKRDSGPEAPKTTRDLSTRITELSCAGDGHDVEMTFDSAKSKVGPSEVILDGKSLPMGGLKMGFAGGSSVYEIAGLKMEIKSEEMSKKNFSKNIEFQGKVLPMKCRTQSEMKFLRQRSVDAPEKSESGAGVR